MDARELKAAAHAEPLGLYVHIPFCVDRCSYCSFVTTRDDGLKASVLQGIEADFQGWGRVLERPPIDTLYFGGGTPSVLAMTELEALARCLRDAFDVEPILESTLEANPGTVDLEWLQRVRHLGFDRVSLGIQTLDDGLLQRLGRIHDGKEGLRALAMAQEAGFLRRSADLMVGIPGQRLERVLLDARRLVDAGADHLSVYLLDLDKACPLKAQVESGKLQLPSEDEVAEVFEALQEELPRIGLAPYEISNYARPGQESRHNTRYWERRPYLGIGPSAASQLGSWRWTESGVIHRWAGKERSLGTESLDSRFADVELQELGADEALAEIPLLGLRMHRGVDWTRVCERAAEKNLLPLVESWEVQMEPLLKQGLLTREKSILRFTAKGMLLSNEVFRIFV